MRGPRLLALLLTLAVAPIFSARAGAGTARAQGDQGGPLEAANAVLDRREAALRSGDAAAWMATVDPAAPEQFEAAQARQFAGLRSLPIEGYALTARLDDTGDLAPEADRFLPETRMSYRIRDVESRDAIDVLWLTFVRREGEWYVGSDTDLADLGLDTTRGLWDFGDVVATASEHFVVLHHPPQAERARALADLAEQALATLRERWTEPWSQRLVIVLPSSVEELEEILQSTIDLDKFVAFVSYGTVRDEGWTATVPRMYIQDRNLASYGRGFQTETLVHELVHAASAHLAGPFVAAWVHEGVADWVATGRSTTERKPSGSDGVIPRDHEFSTGSQESIVRAYRESRSVISALARRAGISDPAAFFVAAGRERVAPGSTDHRLDAALRSVAGFGLDELESGWADR